LSKRPQQSAAVDITSPVTPATGSLCSCQQHLHGWIVAVQVDTVDPIMVEGAIGNYRILRKIGEGGMGAVYVAEHVLIGRQAAIKVLLREMSHRQDLVTRFFNEARAATAVKHPGIVEIYDFGYHSDGSAYIVMEYLEGESLSARLARSGTIAEVRAAALCRQVASALAAAHAKGIVHRDLKPDNIYIVRDPDIADGERIKILDFGIAKLATADLPGLSVTRTGTVLGTPPYMSPEACKGAGGVDHRADLYALGCILFEMVCGRCPFVAEGGGEIMAQHIYAPVPLPSSLGPVTPPLEQVILRALAKDPSQRFQSADDMSAALQLATSPAMLRPAGAPERLVAWHPVSAHEMTRVPVAPVAAPTQQVTPIPQATPAPQAAAIPQAALPRAATVVSLRTTLSQASAVTSTASPAPYRRRAWLISAVAVAVIAGVIAIALGVRSSGPGDGSGVIASESGPAPPLASSPHMHGVSPSPSSTPAPPSPAAPSPSVPAPPAPSAAPPASESPAFPGPPLAPARVTVKLASEPPGAEVYRAPEVLVGRTPMVYTIEAAGGDVVLTVKKRGYSSRQVTVTADRDSDLKVTLARVAAPTPPRGAASATDSAGPPAVTGGSLDPFEKIDRKKPGDKR
jgi:hypothetical protein